MSKPLLTLMMGLPRAGKSREVGRMRKSLRIAIVSPDSIRLAMHGKPFIYEAEGLVWATAKIMARSLFISGHDHVVVDATNMSRSSRDVWKDEMWDRNVIHIPTPWKVCRDRADSEIMRTVIDRMDSSKEEIHIDEGFIQIVTVENDQKGEEADGVRNGPDVARHGTSS